MNDIKLIKLRHELKSLIDGGIRNIDRFDDILNELVCEAMSTQHQADQKALEDFLENF